MSTPNSADAATTLDLTGFEVDNLLAFLAHLGLLRALEAARPAWTPRTSWDGPPWRARLHLTAVVTAEGVAGAVCEGIDAIAASYDVDGRANVKFERAAFRSYAKRIRQDPVSASLAAALTSEWPPKRDGDLAASPLVLLFGQGHQNFLDRLVAVARGELPARHRKAKRAPDFRSPARVADALFAPWRRDDDADAFRWDPAEDQRYALRFDDPSAAGAALTVAGANRLAVIGLLSFACVPTSRAVAVPGTVRERGEVSYVWPVWGVPLGLHGIERLLSHPGLSAGDASALRPFGVTAVYRARRVPNGKFMNVTRAISG